MPEKSKDTRVTLHFVIQPLKNIKYGIGGILGNFNADFIARFFTVNIGRKINVIVSELVNNVIENVYDKKGKIDVKIDVDPEKIKVTVKNKVDKKQYEYVKEQLAAIKKSKDIKKLLKDTIKDRRKKKLKGGLGLIRLTSETKAKTSVRYNKKTSYMSISAKLATEESE